MEINAEMIVQAVEGVKKAVPREYVRQCSKEQVFPQKLWDAVAAQGLLGLGVPEELGGAGGGLSEMCVLLETLNREGVGLQAIVVLGMCRTAILRHGTEEQKQRFVVPTIDGGMMHSFAITEPDAGTNTFKMRTLATRQPNGSYRLNGQKTFTSSFGDSDYCMVVARTIPFKDVSERRHGISLFMVDTKSKGIEKTLLELGTNIADQQWTEYFDDVKIPPENLIGEEGKGIEYLFSALNPERMIVASMCLGIGDFVLSKGVEYARYRDPFDKPIGAYQSLQHPMAYTKARLEAARLMRNRGAELYDSGLDCGPEANMAKLLASDAAVDAVNVALQALGGSGMAWENDVIGFLAHMKITQIAPISNQMILNYIGQHVLGLPKSY